MELSSAMVTTVMNAGVSNLNERMAYFTANSKIYNSGLFPPTQKEE